MALPPLTGTPPWPLLQKLVRTVNNRGFPPDSPAAASSARPSASPYTNQQQQQPAAAPAAPGPLFSSVTGLPLAAGAGAGAAAAAASVPAMAAAPGSEPPLLRCCFGMLAVMSGLLCAGTLQALPLKCFLH